MASGGKRPLLRVLVERGLFGTEDDARRWIMAGHVLVDGQRIDKAWAPVPVAGQIDVRGRPRYASRGGYKLATALDYFGVAVDGRVALDCGASAGGFTDCLLQRGASLVYAVDAGHGQLLGRLRSDPRVRNLERTNLGALSAVVLDPRPALVTLDLSYLSLTHALPLTAALVRPGAEVLALVKPLFEVDDPEARRTGRIGDESSVTAAVRRVLDSAEHTGFAIRGAAKLALRPRHGVPELFLHLSLGAGGSVVIGPEDLAGIVSSPGIGPSSAQD